MKTKNIISLFLFLFCLTTCLYSQDKIGKTYYDGGNKKILSIIPYSSGKINGMAKWYYESGEIMEEDEYKDDKLDGLHISYYKNGKIEYIANYKDGKKNGEQKYYDREGNLKVQSSYIDDTLFNEATITEKDNNLGIVPKPKAPAIMVVSNISFKDIYGKNKYILNGNEQAEINFVLSNQGKGDGYNLIAEINEVNKVKGLEFSKIKIIGTIEAGKDKIINIPVSGTMLLETGKADFEIIIKEGNGFDADPFKISFSTMEFKYPKVIIADSKFTTNEQGKIKLGYPVTLNVVIQNQGQGDAKDVTISFTNPPNVFNANETSFSFPKLEPNESKKLNYEFFANKQYKGSEIPIQVEVSESFKKYGDAKTLVVSLEQSLAKTQQIDVDAKYEKQVPIEKVSLTSDVDVNLPKTNLRNPNAFAVIIGNSDYKTIKNVDYAINDALSMKKYLINVLGYSEGNIFFVTNATKSDFETFFGTKDNPEGKLFNNIKPDVSDVFIYYAGHGAPGLSDKKGYFVPVDCDPQYVQQGGYSLDLFYSNLAKLPAKSITVLTDACFSGAEILKNISAITITVSNPIIMMKNCVVMSSCTGSQVSTWFNEKQHGMFTYFFLKALQDRVKSDKNKDGKLTFNEIFDYISDKTEGVPYYARKLNNIEQTPCIQGTGMDNVFIDYK